MSLRVRLVATLLALAAAGLVVLGAVTYISQRDFEHQRVDDQTTSALPSVAAALTDVGIYTQGRGGGFGPGRERGDGRFDPQIASIPGVYGQRRDALGNVLCNGTTCGVQLTYGQEAPPAPRLPAHIEAGDLLTVGAVSGDLRYRVRASPDPGGGTTIVAIPLSGVDETLDRLLLVEGLVIGGVLLLLAGLSWVLVGVGLRPLERIGATADAIAAGDLSRRVDVAAPKTEVGRLGVAFNAMLGRLETAFAEREASEGRLRQFLSDASHELRTPLASIRGYAELFRIGAARSEQDTEKAMRRIEDEAARMGVLVEDLLTLARLDEVRELPTTEVDLVELAADAADDARAMSPGRTIDDDAEGELVVMGEANQLRQVLANLVRNALVHTPVEAGIEIHVRRVGERAEVEVRDHGPGLPTGDPQALFERFWRAEAGRGRGRAGAGLGLAIVAGIVHAHGGEVRAANAPGGGASFVVALPLAASADSAGSGRATGRLGLR